MKKLHAHLRITLPLATLLMGGLAQADIQNQISIKTRILEVNGDAKDVMSAPQLTVLNKQEGRIEIGTEHIIRPEAPASLLEFKSVFEGIEIVVAPEIQGNNVQLKGTATLSEFLKAGAHTDENNAWGTVRQTVTSFVLLLTPGATQTLRLPGEQPKTSSIEMQFTADILPLVNAAPVYWQAFSLLPPKPGEDSDLATKAWVESAAPALAALHQAASMAACEWELDYSKGPAMNLPHLMQARNLAKAAIARARQTFSTHPKAGIQDVQDALTLSRHLASDPILICQLVRISIEKMAYDAVTENLGKLDAVQLEQLVAFLKQQPPPVTLADCVELERTTYLGYIRTSLEEGSGRDKIKELGLDAWNKNINAQNLEQLLQIADADYTEMVEIALRPLEEQLPAFAAFEKNLKENREGHLLAALIAPSLHAAAKKFGESIANTEAFIASLEARGKSKAHDPVEKK